MKNKITIPLGKYFLGDPCYAVPENRWHEVLNASDYLEKPFIEDGEIKVLAFGTSYGDGEYNDQFGNSYPVDAGMIGLTNIDLIENKEDEWLNKSGIFVEVSGETKCWNEDGVLYFGKFIINTKLTKKKNEY